MQRILLGRTGLDVSVMGVGAGGPSQIGKKTGKSERESADIILKAFDAGVNYIDTAENYGTEPLVGLALKDLPRDQVVISTKKSSKGSKPSEIAPALEASLERLGTDVIDVYSLHGVYPDDYARCREELYPELLKLKESGKIRFIGITEMFNADKTHHMLQAALVDDLWDVMMVGYNIINQTAATSVFPGAIERDVGIQIMFAVRRALSKPDDLKTLISELIAAGQLDEADFPDLQDPLGFVRSGGAASVPDAAYRFCRDQPGTHVILSGTGNPNHLAENIASFGRPSLSSACVEQLRHTFRNVDSVTGQ